MRTLQTIVLILAIITFVIGIGLAVYEMSMIVSLAEMNILDVMMVLWFVLSSFCILCVVYWVTEQDFAPHMHTAPEAELGELAVERAHAELRSKGYIYNERMDRWEKPSRDLTEEPKEKEE